MKKILFCFWLLPMALFAQVTDDFSDGNYSSNPLWTGDDTEFKINTNYQLQSNGIVTDTSYLSTPVNINGDSEWNIWIKLSFSPSDNNYVRIYLLSDVDNLRSPLNGYYIRIGETGSDDSIDLYRQTGLSSVKIIDGIAGNVSLSTNTLKLKVIRDTSGNWQVFSDISVTGSYITEGSCYDNTYISGLFFGVVCNYTSSNSTKFYFDDIYAGDIIVDSIPPSILSTELISDSVVSVFLSEAADAQTLTDISGFFIPQINIHPESIVILTPSNINLIFSYEFQSETNYFIEISGIIDLFGNLLNDTIVEFSFYKLSANHLVITEIMADPYPVVNLPEAEYIEIYNASGRDLVISDLFLESGETTKEIPEFLIDEGEFLIICSTLSEVDFQTDINIVGISGFPSLTNTGQAISLKYEQQIINSVSYSENWYSDIEKEDGGWSLEKIDPRNNCSTSSNWKASVDPDGGTPGKINSVFSGNIDSSAPVLLQIRLIDSMEVSLKFSEEIYNSGSTDNNSFTIIQNGLHPYQIVSDDNIQFSLLFSNPFNSGNNYEIEIGKLVDLCGNLLTDTLVSFTYYEAKAWDIIINEIMSDPSPAVDLPESDYLEIINRAEFAIDLTGWVLSIGDKYILFGSDIISPGEMVILVPEENGLIFGPFTRTINILGSNDLTSEGKVIALTDAEGEVISSVDYSPVLHSDNYKSEGGWSIERIDFNNTCEVENNWASAVNPVGGTPGRQNSVYAPNPDINSPYSIRVQYLDTVRIRLIFSEQMEINTLADVNNYFASGGLGHPKYAIPDGVQYNSVTLGFLKSIELNTKYTLTIKSICDCGGNTTNTNSEFFGIPELTNQGDIVINEILFNPADDGVDYIELYNRSYKIFDLSELLLASKEEASNEYVSVKEISPVNYLLFPDEFFVLTTSKSKVTEQYYYSDYEAFIYPDIQIPTMSNTSGRIILMNRGGTVIDDFSYSEDMHHSLLNSFEGVSLERINYNNETNNRNNWHSAAETFGFGTPGVENSQYSDFVPADVILSIEPEIFSPDNDGNDDFVSVSYVSDKPGNVGTIIIYDSNSRKIKTLLINTLLSANDILTWDGTDDSGGRCTPGIYIILFEYFNPDGTTGGIKKIVVLGKKLS